MWPNRLSNGKRERIEATFPSKGLQNGRDYFDPSQDHAEECLSEFVGSCAVR